METTVYCAPEEFCIYQTETGGGKALRFHCMNLIECKKKEKKCLFRKQDL